MTKSSLFAVLAVSLFAAAVAVVAPICADEKSGGKKAATGKDTGEKPAAKVTLEVASWEETQKLVAVHKGKIVVLDAWSTSCQPCMKEFPNLVKMHQKYGGKQVACMSLSCDYQGIKNKPPEYYRERVMKFLDKQGAIFQNLLASEPAEDLYEKMELASIPAVFVYDRNGKLVKRFDNEQAKTEDDNFTYEDVNKLVEELLKAK